GGGAAPRRAVRRAVRHPDPRPGLDSGRGRVGVSLRDAGPGVPALPAHLPRLPTEVARPRPARGLAARTERGRRAWRLKHRLPPSCWRSSVRCGRTSPGSGSTRRSIPTGWSRRTAASAARTAGFSSTWRGTAVVGFEPWLYFPFNKGMLCPKGVRRYLQSSHHDRLTSAYFRDTSSPEGFRAVPYDEAINRVASEIRRIQSAFGNDAFAV